MKRIGTEDGTREYQPLALEVVGGLDIGEYDYSELREVELVSDSLLRMGDRLGQGFIWDVSEEGLVLRHEPRSVTGKPYYTTLGWGESLKVKVQNPTGALVGIVTEEGIRRIGWLL